MGKTSSWARLAVALSIGTASAADAQTVMSMSQFRAKAAERIKAEHPSATVTFVGANQLRIAIPGGDTFTSNLDRAYAVYEGSPDQLADVLKGLSGSIRARRTPAKLDSIVILVRPDSYMPKKGVLRRPVAGGMSAIVAQDEPDSFEFPSVAELHADLKLDDAAIWSRALANTRARIRIAPRRQMPGRISHLSTGGYFASSILADDTFWDSKELSADGPVVVAALARDDIYLAPLKDAGMVEALRRMMAEVRNDPNGLTNDLIVRRNGHWETLR